MKTILLPLESGDGLQSMLETAWLAATAFGSTIQGLYIRRALPGVVVADIGGYAAAAPDLVESFEAEDRERGASARRAFEEFLRGKGVTLGEPPGAGPPDVRPTSPGPTGEERPSATWAEEIPPGDAAVGMYARLFDLTVVGRPVPGASTPAASTLEQRVRSSIGNRTCDALDALPQVTIGAVNGLAVGGAVVFLSCMDMRLAAESAWFSIPEVELDIPLTWNALPRLIREIGPARTKELVMLCERFSSDDALRWGFVNHVHPDGALISEARRMAERLLSMDPLAIARTKAATSALAVLLESIANHTTPLSLNVWDNFWVVFSLLWCRTTNGHVGQVHSRTTILPL